MNENNRIGDSELESVNGGRMLLKEESDAVSAYEKKIKADMKSGLISEDDYLAKLDNLSDYKFFMEKYQTSKKTVLFDENIMWSQELR